MLADHIYNLSVYGGISLTAFLIFLLAQDRKQLHKRILIGILLHFLVLFTLYGFLSEQIAIRMLPLFLLLLYTIGPLVYSYIEAVYNVDLTIDRSFYRRFRLTGIALLVVLGIVAIHPSEEFRFHSFLVLAVIGLASLWWYYIAAYRQLRRYRQLIKEEYANIEALELKWLSNWMKGLFLLLLSDVLLGTATGLIPVLQNYVHLNVLAYSFFIVYIGYQGLLQNGVLLPARIANPRPSSPEAMPSSNPENTQKKYAASSSFPSLGSTEDIKEHIEALNSLLQKEELFRQNDLSLRQLAEHLSLNEKQLSALLNQHLRTNFYEYINSFRVEAFQQAVHQGQAEHFTLLAIALDCGFSSKSSFNRIFKQQTGMTPTAFKNRSNK